MGAQEDFAYHEKFGMVCEIHWLPQVVLHGMWNFAQPCETTGYWTSSLYLWLVWKRAMKCSKAWILHVFELQLALPLISQYSLSFWLVSMIKKLPKIPKLTKNWLVTLARFLNVPIELKGINYYSKVCKIVSFKL